MHRFFVPTLECLEGRAVPAGIINSSYSSLTKTLTLTAVNDLDGGDALLNSQNIAVAGTGTPGEFTVEGNNGETINGVAAGEAVISNVKNIKLVMGLGGDTVTIRNASLSGQLTFLGGEGDSTLDINASNGPNTLGRVLVRNGDGFDVLRLVTGSNTITGGLTVNNGSGGCFALIGEFSTDQTSIGGPVRVTNGAGTDTLSFGGQNLTLSKAVTIQNGSGDSSIAVTATGTASVNGPLTVVNGDGFDEAQFGESTQGTVSLGDVSLRNGGGGSSTTIGGNTHTFAGLRISNGDGDDTLDCTTGSVSVTGALIVQNGNGDSTINLNPVFLEVGGPTTLGSAAGNDTVVIGRVAAELHSLTVLTGHGTAAVQFGSNVVAVSPDVTITGNFTFTGGRDADLLVKDPDAQLNVTGNVTINLGNSSTASPQEVDLDSSGATGSTSIGGKLTVRGGDQVDQIHLPNVHVTGTALFDLGEDEDVVDIDTSTFGAVTIKAGGGDDDIRLESTNNGTGTTFAGAFTFLGGTGNDQLDIGFDDVGDFVTFGTAPVRLDGGVGLDTLDRATVDNVFPANQPIELSWETIT